MGRKAVCFAARWWDRRGVLSNLAPRFGIARTLAGFDGHFQNRIHQSGAAGSHWLSLGKPVETFIKPIMANQDWHSHSIG